MSKAEFAMRPVFARDLKWMARLDDALCGQEEGRGIAPWKDDDFLQATAGPKAGAWGRVIVDDTDVPLAYVCWGWATETHPTGTEQPVMRLSRLGVNPAYGGRGWGRRLAWTAVNAMVDDPACKAIVIELPERALRLSNYFKGLGFPSFLRRGPGDEDGFIVFRLARALVSRLREGQRT